MSFGVTLIHIKIFSTFCVFLGLSVHSVMLELLLFLTCLLPQLEIPVLSHQFKLGQLQLSSSFLCSDTSPGKTSRNPKYWKWQSIRLTFIGSLTFHLVF